MRKLRGYFRLMRRKIVRDPLPPESVAAGWALGMFIGCAIPFGMQLVVSLPLAAMMRVSKVGATLGTFITNPVTILFIYPMQTWAVNKVLFGSSLSYEKLVETKWCWQAVRSLGPEVMASFFLGGMILGMILAPLTYFAVRRIVLKSRARRAALRQ
jgi:hypothetical protein